MKISENDFATFPSPRLPYISKEKRREEILVDTKNYDERVACLENYVEEYLQFPFNAEWRQYKGETKNVTVLKIADERNWSLLVQARIMGTKELVNISPKQLYVKEKKMPNYNVLSDLREVNCEDKKEEAKYWKQFKCKQDSDEEDGYY